MTKASKILDDVEETAPRRETVTIGSVNEKLGRRGIGALVMVPASLELTPLGGLPGVPTMLALIVLLLAVQIVLGRTRMWLPDVIERRGTKAKRIRTATDTLRPLANWADRHLGQTMTWLVDEPAPRVAALAIILLCLAVPALELVPFASSIPMGTIVLFGLAMVTRDGRVMAAAWLAFAAAWVAVWLIWP